MLHQTRPPLVALESGRLGENIVLRLGLPRIGGLRGAGAGAEGVELLQSAPQPDEWSHCSPLR